MTPTELQEKVGRILHETWMQAKRARGFHGPDEACSSDDAEDSCYEHSPYYNGGPQTCSLFRASLVPWEQLPPTSKHRENVLSQAASLLASGLLVDAEKLTELEASFRLAAERLADTEQRRNTAVKRAYQAEAEVARLRKVLQRFKTWADKYSDEDGTAAQFVKTDQYAEMVAALALPAETKETANIAVSPNAAKSLSFEAQFPNGCVAEVDNAPCMCKCHVARGSYGLVHFCESCKANHAHESVVAEPTEGETK